MKRHRETSRKDAGAAPGGATPAADAGAGDDRLRQPGLAEAIAQSLGEGVYALDREGRVTFMNPAAERMLGWTEAELLGRRMHDVIHSRRADGTHVPIEECPLLEVLHTGQSYRSDDDTYTRRDGVLLPVSYTSSPVMTGGEVAGAVVAFRDMTERRRVEAELRASQELNQAVLDSLNAHIAVLDRDGVIVAVNEAWRRFAAANGGAPRHTGLRVNYLQVCRDAADEGGAAGVLAGVEAVLGGGRAEFTAEYACHSPGEERWFLLYATPLAGGRGGAVVSHINITERKRAEAALRESEAQFRTLSDSIPQLAWMADREGSIFWYNRRWYEYTGTTFEEMRGWGWQKVHHPEEVGRVAEGFRRAVAAGEPWEDTFPLRGRDGQYRRFLSRALPIRDAEGRVARWFGTNTDIEEQKRMEELLARLSREREQMLEEVSTPVVPVLEGVLVLPIVGTLDAVRMERATAAALGEVARTGARTCIIDITGSRLVDSHAVANLSNLAGALRLVGAQAVITGVGPHAAQSLVGLGLDLGTTRTHRTLAQALAALIREGRAAPGRGKGNN